MSLSIHADITATHAAVLAHLADDLHQQPSDADAVIDGGELYSLIRLCLLKVERQRRPRDTHDADCLYVTLTAAYERSGAFVGTSRGQRFYDVGALYDAAQEVAGQSG